MVNHETNQVFIDNLEIPVENLIGEEGKGFRYILDGLNAERILIAAECIGDGYWFVEKATNYSKERVVFDRPIGENQGIQFPIAEAYMEIEAANLMRYKAAGLFDEKKPCGAEANMAKHLCAKASWEAANVCLQTHGGFGFARRVRRRAQVPREPPLPSSRPSPPTSSSRTSPSTCSACRAPSRAWTRAIPTQSGELS
jgi:acyl-CoA dehydrogenase